MVSATEEHSCDRAEPKENVLGEIVEWVLKAYPLKGEENTQNPCRRESLGSCEQNT